MPDPANLTIKLAPSRRRMAKSQLRLFAIIAASDAKNYARNPPRAFLPIFPTDDAALTAAINLVKDRLSEVVYPDQ